MSNKENRIYISGPISGREREVYMRHFAEAEAYLKGWGFDVVNPTRLLPCKQEWLYKLLGYRLTLLYDLLHLRRCGAIFMLEGWEHSAGARLELRKAYNRKMYIVYE